MIIFATILINILIQNKPPLLLFESTVGFREKHRFFSLKAPLLFFDRCGGFIYQ